MGHSKVVWVSQSVAMSGQSKKFKKKLKFQVHPLLEQVTIPGDKWF